MNAGSGIAGVVSDVAGDSRIGKIANIIQGILATSANIAERGPEIGDALQKAIDATKEMYDDGSLFNPEYAKGFLCELGESWSKTFYSKLPDALNPWLSLNRDGKYYVYDPLVLDLGKTGIDTVGTSNVNGSITKTYFDHNQAGIKPLQVGLPLRMDS